MHSAVMRLAIATLCTAGALSRAGSLPPPAGDEAGPATAASAATSVLQALGLAMPAVPGVAVQAGAEKTVATRQLPAAAQETAPPSPDQLAGTVAHAAAILNLPVSAAMETRARHEAHLNLPRQRAYARVAGKNLARHESDAQASENKVSIADLPAWSPGVVFAAPTEAIPAILTSSQPGEQNDTALPRTPVALEQASPLPDLPGPVAESAAALPPADALPIPLPIPLPDPKQAPVTAVLVQREPQLALPPPVSIGLVDDRPPRKTPTLKMSDTLEIAPAVEPAAPAAEPVPAAAPAAPSAGLATMPALKLSSALAPALTPASASASAPAATSAIAAAAVPPPPSASAATSAPASAAEDAPDPRLPLIFRAMTRQLAFDAEAAGTEDMAAPAQQQARTYAVAAPVVDHVSWTGDLSNESKTVIFGQQSLLAASDSKLDQLRGGFDAGNGLQVSFGITRVAYINGNLATTSSFNIADVSKITSEQAATLNKQLNSVNLVQTGQGNHYLAGQGGGAAAGTVIQNTLNNQSISTRTVIDASANSAGILRTMNLQRTLNEAVGSGLRR